MTNETTTAQQDEVAQAAIREERRRCYVIAQADQIEADAFYGIDAFQRAQMDRDAFIDGNI